ncbi:SRA-YDG, partial [Ramaria rubella]
WLFVVRHRRECSYASVHGPWVAGIHGTAAGGAYSIALSGGYQDDVDLGYTFTYTGAGGRDLKGTPDNPKNLRVAPQSSDQTFEHAMNAALKAPQVSAETKKPIRVIRGFKLNSAFAPTSGYRYDGLYVVDQAWREIGKEGFRVCRYRLNRLPGQALLP